MYKYFLYTLLFFICSSVIGQQLPPGVVKVDSIYIDQTEVTNVNWTEYLHYLKQDSTKEAYTFALPDTTVWYQVYDSAIAAPLVQSGYKFAGLRYMPIVGITQQQAINYCQWRTDLVRPKILADTINYKIKNLQYRLPSEKEWMYVAVRNRAYEDSYVKKALLKSRIPKNKKLKALGEELNYEVEIKVLKKEIKAFYIKNPLLLLDNLNTTANPYFKTLIGVGIGPKYIHFYDLTVENIRGNVSELTLTPGVARGGNWTLTEKESAINVKIRYRKPSALLGFRCLCEIEFEK